MGSAKDKSLFGKESIMKITEIRAFKKRLEFTFEQAETGTEIIIRAQVPLVCGRMDPTFSEGRIAAQFQTVISNGKASIDRYAGEIDLLVYRFDAGCDGVCYVTEVEEEVSAFCDPYPVRPLKAIGMHALEEDLDELGFAQSSMGPNQAHLMLMHEGEDTIPHIYNGKTYYFRKSLVEETDADMQRVWKRGITVVMRYISSSFFIGEKADQEIVDIIQHPGYDYGFPSAYMGAFNLRTEAGFEYFCSCTDFLLSRYCRPDHKYGWATSFEVGNEVTSQYVWGNAGEMTCAEYMYEYTEVMRICWLLSRKYWSNFRIHTSFDQYFCGSHVPTEPNRYYGMKESIDEIYKNCQRDGDFPWNIAFHPYPENLSYPDFWNDRTPNWSFETNRITFKNLEVMPAYLAQPHLLYKGKARRIILPEQGFNSRTDAPYTLNQGKYGYVLAYQKMKKLSTIDMFLHHNYLDNPGEFGLNLGIRYCRGYDENMKIIPGDRKPICEAIAALDTEKEAQLVEEARAYIGAEIYDFLMNPPEVAEKLDHSGAGLNLPGQGNRKKVETEHEEEITANFEL